MSAPLALAAMRQALTEGVEVTVHYLSTSEPGVIERVQDDGESLVVITESGTVLEFHLMASAHYVTRDRSARLGRA
jgi:hypothetical protein